MNQQPGARRDLLEQFIYFVEHAGADWAERYIAAVDRTSLQLTQHPHLGRPYDCGIERLRGLRRFAVTGFDKYLIFYIPRENGIDLIRVLHGARDIDSLFEEEAPDQS